LRVEQIFGFTLPSYPTRFYIRTELLLSLG